MYIGIDLGTSNSIIAGIVDGRVRVFRPADGGETLPSVIYFDKRGHRLYGRRAHDQALISPDNVAAGFKRLMGSSTPIEIKGVDQKLSPEECSAEIIRQLLGQAFTETGSEDITGAVITIPAAFNQMQSEATLRAAQMAGLKRVDLLQEPIAAALAAMEGAKRSGQFLIYDLGGGTFDVALAQAVNGEVKIIAHEGINMLGGRDFDRLIVNVLVRPWLAKTFNLPENFQRDPKFSKLIRIAQLAAEKAKIDLSSSEEATIFTTDEDMRLKDVDGTDMYLDVPIKRDQLEELIRPPVLQTLELIRNMLTEHNVKAEEIDRIVFIGGPSRIPLVRQMVATELGIVADLTTDPMTAVAVGAAYYCESRQWDKDNISAPKPKDAETPVGDEPNLSFQYASRTPDEKTIITLRVKGDSAKRQLQIKSKNWDSGVLPVTDGLTISVPLKEAGEYTFNADVLDEKGAKLEGNSQTLSITRLVASTGSIPASQTIAVKVLDNPLAQENILMPIVQKGTPLPTEGKAKFKSARALKSHESGYLSFELFQVEYPERIDLNLCVGVFRVGGEDLPPGYVIKEGADVTFDWRMSDSGILQASVRVEGGDSPALDLQARRFYAPQASQMSFGGDQGVKFADSILKQGEEEWGDLAAASGPEGGPEIKLLQNRLEEQRETLDEAGVDAETIRRVSEEARFIRQDVARIARKHRDAMLQRRLGKMTAVFNRIARGLAEKAESERFDNHAAKVQEIIDAGDAKAYDDGDLHLAEMRDLFFGIAWRDKDYIYTWYKRLVSEPFLFPDQTEFAAMVKEGEDLTSRDEREKLKDLVTRMLAARVALGASDTAAELATIIKT